MEPFLINVVEGGDMYASQIAEVYGPSYSLLPMPTSPTTGRILAQDDYGFAMPGVGMGPRYY